MENELIDILASAETEEGCVVDLVSENEDGTLTVEANDVEFDIPKESPKYFQYANLILECGCGNKETIEVAITEGIQVVLRTTDKDLFALKCSSCGACLSIRFEESTIDEINNKLASDESVSENSEAEQVDMGISTDSELHDEVNA